MDLGIYKGTKIFVGLSGGVDSAVSAALLQEAGADVTGVFIKGWYPPGMPCTWANDRRDAMRVAARLRIPFSTLDASSEYKKGVIDYLLAEYAAGRTPNPDIMCNREVKFGAFYEHAKRNGAMVATGHYAQTQKEAPKHVQMQMQEQEQVQVQKNATEENELLRGADLSKDQSYFLWAIPQQALQHTIFPVGGIPKSEVRLLAEEFNLPVATKKDSQGICFLGSISVDDFLREELSPVPGRAVTEKGELVGMHDGAVLYTLGERIALHDMQKNAEIGPWYVIGKNMKQNTLTISTHQISASDTAEILLRETNFFNKILKTDVFTAQYRYHGPLIEGTFESATNIFTPTHKIEEPIAAGQSLVLYSGITCIGGGIIC
jgi:tRNA-specific 2-thiouridylase